jgi:hypothetical protein
MMSKYCRAFTVSSLLALAAVSGGCSSSADEVVKPKLEVINQSKAALSMADSITAIHGTYGGACSGRAVDGSDQWIVDRAVPANTTLSVVKNDTACVLTMVSIDAGGASYAGASITMDDGWSASSSAFALASGGDSSIKFYGNAMMSATSFTTDFVITVLVSDSPNASNAGEKGATGYATRSATLETGTVAAPDYTIGFGGFGVNKDIGNVVDAVYGYAQLGAEDVTGEDFAIVSGAPASFAEVDAAFNGVPGTHGLISDLPSLKLDASGFALPTVDLDDGPQRTVIIRHTEQGVSSYQLLLVTFTP